MAVRFQFLSVLALSAALAHSQSILTLKARLFDHDYGDFNGEFSETNVGCKFDSYKAVTGMVLDSLAYDPAKGKKIPRRGPVDLCSQRLEKWFDPAESRSATCGNIFLRNAGTAEKPLWKFDDPGFFAMDGQSRQRTWTLPGGGALTNDYAYCMEVNASLTYKGGETMKFRGDDDVWVFLDNRLMMDLGGIHYPMGGEARLDSIPFLKDKLGRTMDLDIYYCSRQPGTAVFGMETDVELKPLPVKSIRIVDSLGADVAAKDVLIGKTRLCARPSFQAVGEEQCGNYKEPPDLSFLSADWDLNGKPLSIEGGQACLDFDPALFPNNTRINITAKAEAHTSRISLTLIRQARPLSGTLTGDGRVEAVLVRLDTSAGPAPDGLEMGFDFAGQKRYARVMPAPSDPWMLSGRLDGDWIGPVGVTGFAPIPATARQTIFTRIVEKPVTLRDGVSPILSGAWFRWGGMNGHSAYLDVQVSEPLADSGDSLMEALVWKRKDGAPAGWAPGAKGLRAGIQRYFLSLPEASAKAMRPGDSVSLSPAAEDTEGNRAIPRFLPLIFPRNLEETVGPMRIRENPVHGPDFRPRAGIRALIPVDASGGPLTGGEAERRLAAARGPVLEFPVLAPIERIRLAFYDHLGAFVNSVDRTISESEWDAIRAASPGDTTWARLMWYPVSRQGSRLGTGAYVVQGSLWTRDGALANGPDGEMAQVRGSAVLIRPRIFGYLRD